MKVSAFVLGGWLCSVLRLQARASSDHWQHSMGLHSRLVE